MKTKKHTYGNASQVTDHSSNYADGGIVKGAKQGNAKQHMDGKKYADGGKAMKSGNKRSRRPRAETLGSGAAADAGRTVGGRQRQIDKALEDAGA